MDTALPGAELPAACTVAATGALADRTDPGDAIVVDLVPADRGVTEWMTPRPDTVEEVV
jgi:hypothetical protein